MTLITELSNITLVNSNITQAFHIKTLKFSFSTFLYLTFILKQKEILYKTYLTGRILSWIEIKPGDKSKDN